MNDNTWLKELKAGDKVVIQKCHFSGNSYKLAKVERITPKGFIRAGDNLYSPEDGRARGAYSGLYLLDYNNEQTKEKLNNFM